MRNIGNIDTESQRHVGVSKVSSATKLLHTYYLLGLIRPPPALSFIDRYLVLSLGSPLSVRQWLVLNVTHQFSSSPKKHMAIDNIKPRFRLSRDKSLEKW